LPEVGSRAKCAGRVVAHNDRKTGSIYGYVSRCCEDICAFRHPTNDTRFMELLKALLKSKPSKNRQICPFFLYIHITI
jgi:hypothetical protein